MKHLLGNAILHIVLNIEKVDFQRIENRFLIKKRKN